MSLINEVLRNLEESRPDDPARQNLQREIRTLPVAKKSHGRLIFWGVFGSLSLAAGALTMIDDQRLSLPDLPWLRDFVPAFVAAPVIPAPAPTPLVETPVAPSAQPAPLAALGDAMLPQPGIQLDLAGTDSPVSPVPTTISPETAVETKVQQVSGLPSAIPPASANAVSAAVSGPKVAEPVAGPALAVAPTPPEPAAARVAVGRIEKTALPPSARELAEREYQRAESLIAAGQLDLAAAGLAQALKIDPAYLSARQKLIRLKLGQRQNDEAMVLLESGLALTPNQSSWAISLARLQLDKGDIAGAIQTLERSRPYAENRADYAGFLGHLKSRTSEHADAAKYYMHAARLSPGEGRWWLGLGLALVAENRQTEATEAFRQAEATGSLTGDLLRMAQQQGK